MSLTLADKILARLTAEYDVPASIEGDVLGELTAYARSKKMSASRLSAAKFREVIDAHTSDVADIIELLDKRPNLSPEEWNAGVAADKARKPSAHADCDHEATKAARAKCRRARAAIAA